jgi:hypothetical protein
MINDELWRASSPARVLDTPWRLAVWLSAVPVAYAMVYWCLPLLGIGYPILVALAIVATLTAVNLVLVCMLPFFERRAEKLIQAWPPILASVAVAFLEIWVSGLIRDGVNALAARLVR